MQVRELYCPSHFGNAYEVALTGEMRDLLKEARYWGYSRFTDWFDTIDLRNVYSGDRRLYNLPEAMWHQKFTNYRIAAELGYELGLVITPNHVFSDQVTPETAAITSDHLFGQLVCPSRPGVTEMILANYRNLFTDFAKRGLRLKAISAGAYDYGGCGCEACRPWIVAFGKLTAAIVQEARAIFGGDVDADLWGWWWTDEDHAAFTEWADHEQPDLFRGFAHHILYGETSYKPRPVPASCRERAFVHIGYGESCGLDKYGHYGPVVAAERLQRTVAFLRDRGADGFLAYSEGFFDDVNKALLAGLATGRFDSAGEALDAYADRHFSGDTRGWAGFIRDFGDIEKADPLAMRARWSTLSTGGEPSWRVRQWEGKLRMLEADHQGRRASDMAARQAAADRYRAAKEWLWRDIWKRGLQRHIFRFDWAIPDWYREAEASRTAPREPEQA